MNKSCIQFGGVDEETQQAICDSTGFVTGELPFRYLRAPLSATSLTYSMCKSLRQKILAKL